MSKHITRKKAILGIATLAVVSPLTLMVGGSPAIAAATDTCDTALFTIKATDSVTGLPIAGARFGAQQDTSDPLGQETFLLKGNQLAVEPAFKSAFNADIEGQEPYAGTSEGLLTAAASQETLGTDNKPAYPADITGTDVSMQWGAYNQWLQDEDGRIAAFKADVERRLAAVSAVQHQVTVVHGSDRDPAFTAHVNEQVAKLQALLDNINFATTFTEAEYPEGESAEFSDFVAAYDQFTNPDNWTFGLYMTPSVEFQDKADMMPDWYTSNENAAFEVGADFYLFDGDLVTNGDGEAQFTTVGVKRHSWKDRGTRGDDTCSQHMANVVAMKAPAGYKLDAVNTTRTKVAADGTGVGEITFTFTPENFTEPEVPTRTDTGL